MHEQEVKGRHTILQSQQRIYQDCLKRLDHLVKLKTAPQNADGGLLSDEENGRQHMELLKEKARLEELFQDTGHRVAQWLELSEKTFAFACSARQWFATGDGETKKAILTAVGSNLTLKDKTLGIEAKKPFAILETSLPGLPEAKPTFEPKKFRVDKAQSAAFGDGSRSYLCRKDDDRTCRWTQEEKKVVQRIWHHAQTCPDEGPALLGMLRHLATPPPVASLMRSTSVRRGHQS